MTFNTSFMLYAGTAWLALKDVDVESSVDVSRPSSTLVTLGGRAYVQSAARATRSWRLSYPLDDPTTVRWLATAAQGLLGDVYLLDVGAAQTNMLDPLVTIGRDAAQPTIAVDGVQLRTFAVSTVFTHLVRNAVPYVLSGWTTRASGSGVGTMNVNGGGAVTINAPAGSGSRRWTYSFTPGADGTAVFAITAAGYTSGLMLTQGAVSSTAWAPGENTPVRVSVSDPQRSVQWLEPNKAPLADFTVTLQQVG